MVIQNLSFGFKKHPIFSGINMVFEKGKVTGVVGQNGVGKTTLFRVIKGIYRSQQGSIHFNGDQILKRDIGFLPTDPYFYPYMKGKEYLELILGTKNNDKIADLLGLRLEEFVHNYSTGMKKKIAFAALIEQNKPINILDEPFNGVDLESNVILRKLISSRSPEKVTIISSHILESMMDLCDKIYFIKEGFQYKLYSKESYGLLQKELSDSITYKVEKYNKYNT